MDVMKWLLTPHFIGTKVQRAARKEQKIMMMLGKLCDVTLICHIVQNAVILFS